MRDVPAQTHKWDKIPPERLFHKTRKIGSLVIGEGTQNVINSGGFRGVGLKKKKIRIS
jgi:hypothetical protein